MLLGAGTAQAALGAGQFCSLSKQNYYKKYGYICKRVSDGRYRLQKYRVASGRN